ncbi:unnamed protein product, partial [Cladocopium goreaui]
LAQNPQPAQKEKGIKKSFKLSGIMPPTQEVIRLTKGIFRKGEHNYQITFRNVEGSLKLAYYMTAVIGGKVRTLEDEARKQEKDRLRQRDQFSAAVDAAMGFGSTEQKAHRGLGPKGTDCAI